jgi:hypothetical protein
MEIKVTAGDLFSEELAISDIPSDWADVALASPPPTPPAMTSP